MSSATSGPHRDPPTDETPDLIASDKVEGTAVYDPKGERLGSVYNFMIHKRSGQVAYVVLSFGGFLGIGATYHPLPWQELKYHPVLGGYVVSLTREQLERAPTYSASDASNWNDPAFTRRIDGYYRMLRPRV